MSERRIVEDSSRFDVDRYDLGLALDERDALLEALKAIRTAVSGDAKSECWTLRKWLSQQGVYHDNLTGPERLVFEACEVMLKREHVDLLPVPKR